MLGYDFLSKLFSFVDPDFSIRELCSILELLPGSQDKVQSANGAGSGLQSALSNGSCLYHQRGTIDA